MTIEQEVREELRTLALTDFDRFLRVVNVDLTTLEICKRRQKDKSIRQIAAAMRMNYGKVFRACQECA